MREWSDIIAEAIGLAIEKRGEAVPGAIFKQVVESISDRPLPEEKFADFLGRYNEIVTIARRKGQDILVLPKGETNLLLSKKKSGFKLRKDFYRAFSSINLLQTAWYNRDEDVIIWLAKGKIPTGNYLAIPLCSEESEIAVRNSFIEKHDDAELKARLSESLTKKLPLSTFSREIRQSGLLDEWFNFRTESMLNQIKKWVVDNELDWHDAWISDEGVINQINYKEDPKIEVLTKFISSMDESDLARITIPMDLLLKYLKYKQAT